MKFILAHSKNMIHPNNFLIIFVFVLIAFISISISYQPKQSFFTTNNRFRRSKLVLSSEKPYPKVPASAWKWPVSWPFPSEYLDEVSPTDFQEMTHSSRLILKNHLMKFVSDNSSTLEVALSSPIFIDSNKFILYDSIMPSDIHSMESTPRRNIYDNIILTSGVESLTEPRSSFRTIWKALKPGGNCYICFFGKPVNEVKTSVRMWTTMTDEQKIWIAGSYYRYSINNGWTTIEGYDILNSTSIEMEFKNSDFNNSLYAVKATKMPYPNSNESSPKVLQEKLAYELLGYEEFDLEDKSFLSSRLATFDSLDDTIDSGEISSKIEKIHQIYGAITGVNGIIPKSIKAILAVQLVDNWTNSDGQIQALKRGLGIETPDAEFWIPVGTLTSKLRPREKIHLLADIVSSWHATDDGISSFPTALSAISESLRVRLLSEGNGDDAVSSSSVDPDANEGSIQQLSVDFAINDFLLSPSTSQNKNTSLSRILSFIQAAKTEDLINLAKKCNVDNAVDKI